MPKSEIELIYDVAIAEVGYLEKASNANLDSKTANAGYNNYTKYWRDLRLAGLLRDFGYGPDSNFAGGANWPYCAAGVSWAFMKALGIDRMTELLLHSKTGCFINCDSLAWKSSSRGQLYSKPQVGDVALFCNKNYYHTEFVWKVEENRFYTIGWNTSGASAVIANGGGVCSKKYYLSNTSVKFHRPAYKTYTTVGDDKKNDISVTFIKLGSSGSPVKDIQTKLIYIGFDCGTYGADGDFGNDTLKAVRAFQEKYNLEVDGIVGEQTTKKLNEVYTAEVENKKSQTTSKPKSSDPTKRDILFNGYCNGDYVNVRVWAGTEYGNITSTPQLFMNDQVEVLDYTQKDMEGNDWYFIRINSKIAPGEKVYGFIHSRYISRS